VLRLDHFLHVDVGTAIGAASLCATVGTYQFRKRFMWSAGIGVVLMSTTIIASLLVGAVLSLRFKVLILVPTIIAAWTVLTGIGLVWEITAAWVVLEIVVVTTALEVGYLATLLMEGLAIRPN
jgi:hypothetical protein